MGDSKNNPVLMLMEQYQSYLGDRVKPPGVILSLGTGKTSLKKVDTEDYLKWRRALLGYVKHYVYGSVSVSSEG